MYRGARPRPPIVAIGSILGMLAVSGCTIPRGSLARPVHPVEKGRNMVAVGFLVPFAAVGSASFDDEANIGPIADELVLIPALSFDHALDRRHYLGVELTLLTNLTSTAEIDENTDSFGIFLNPRWEMALVENISLTIDLNLGYVTVADFSFFYLSPTVGGRFYIPTGFGGFVISQQVTSVVATIAFPGSLAYDFPVELGETTLHIFPEARWDPNVFTFTGDTGILALFSGGLTFMFEI